MKKLLLAGLIAGLAASGAPVAHAAPNYDWRGLACSFETLNDTTPGGQLGGQNVWNGLVAVAVRAVNNDDPDGTGPAPATPAPTTAISVSCDLSINGGTPTTVLTAAGTGFAQNADQIQFTAASGSVIVLCSNFVIGGESIQDCGTAEESPVCPDPICGPGGVLEVVLGVLFDQVLIPLAEQIDAIIADIFTIIGPTVDPILDDINERSKVLDQFICPALILAAPVVNEIDPTLIYIDSSGDTYLFGDGVGGPPEALFWNCPPY